MFRLQDSDLEAGGFKGAGNASEHWSYWDMVLYEPTIAVLRTVLITIVGHLVGL